ncbi:class I SAM-dependent methyltransferase [Glycomyces xiaoerkulensis]|uniref:class I SAM-dependent methyltransferase n=1 Tax=Glycomyces xiaoerkulensis TaxID=2038139 RepID=UPI000C25F567|nr:class I SAM-dependent methyltransferase [Glycomyces xiaoerkulensis]
MNKPMRDFERLSTAIDAIAVHVQRYERYASELARARAELAAMRRDRPGLRAALDDMEAELSYLRVRAARPGTVVQIGCDGGWSAAWLLLALRDNAHGRLCTFSPAGEPARAVPAELAAERWEFTAGDVRKRAEALPAEIGYLFVDGPHSARFARWYLANLVAPLAPGTPVSVHDVFHHRRLLPFGEAAVLLGWLHRHRIDYFTAAPARQPVVHRQLGRVRMAMGFYEDLRRSQRNPMVFFQAP